MNFTDLFIRVVNKRLFLAAIFFILAKAALASGIIISPGAILDVNATLNVSGNFINAGTLAGNGTVAFTGGAGATQNITGSSNFYNLTCTAGGTQLNFEADKTQTVRGALTLTGQAGSNIVLKSSASGTQWKIDPQGSRTVRRVDVKDSNNINATSIAAANSTDSGNNTNWFIYETGPDDVPPTVTVIRPDGSETINSGSYYGIAWTATDEGSGLGSNPITLRFSTNEGNSWSLIASSLENTGAYSWLVPLVASDLTACRIRAEAPDLAGNLGFDQSNSNFTVRAVPTEKPLSSVTRTSPGIAATLYLNFQSPIAGVAVVVIEEYTGETSRIIFKGQAAVTEGMNSFTADLISQITGKPIERGRYTLRIFYPSTGRKVDTKIVVP